MEFHQGRLLDHVHLRVRDLAASRRFYRAVTDALGIPFGREGERAFSIDELYVSDDREPTAGIHLAFQAADEAAVEWFYEAGLVAGGTDNGRPGAARLPPRLFRGLRARSRRQQRRGRLPRAR